MTPILTSSSLTTTLMSVNLAIIVFIIVLLCGVAGFTIWAAQRRRTWSPFDKHGYIDHARLKREGFHEIGAIRENGPVLSDVGADTNIIMTPRLQPKGSGKITITPPAGAGAIITAVCRHCGKVLRPNPGETVIHHACQGHKYRYEIHREKP